MADNWILESIKPKSDQLNADDLVAGPIEVTISDVKRCGDEKQPVAIVIGDDRQPYKPCKSMRRVLVALWGDQPQKWVGNRLRLYCNPNVMYGGLRVGGIRISHASIDTKIEVMVTETRGKRVAMTIEPLPKVDVFERITNAIKAIESATSLDLVGKYAAILKAEIIPYCNDKQRSCIQQVIQSATERLGGDSAKEPGIREQYEIRMDQAETAAQVSAICDQAKKDKSLAKDDVKYLIDVHDELVAKLQKGAE